MHTALKRTAAPDNKKTDIRTPPLYGKTATLVDGGAAGVCYDYGKKGGRMPYDDDNIFAKILRGEIPCEKIGENENALAFYDINPQAEKHALIVPKGAYVNFADFSANASAAEIADWTHLIGETARTLKVEESGYRLLINNGADAMQEVPHLHAHIVGGEPLGAMLPQRRKP